MDDPIRIVDKSTLKEGYTVRWFMGILTGYKEYLVSHRHCETLVRFDDGSLRDVRNYNIQILQGDL